MPRYRPHLLQVLTCLEHTTFSLVYVDATYLAPFQLSLYGEDHVATPAASYRAIDICTAGSAIAAVDSSRSKGYHRVSLKPWAVCQTKSHCKPSAIQVVRQVGTYGKGPNDYSLELRCHNETHDRTLLVVLGSHV